MKKNTIYIVLFSIVLIWSGLHPKDYFTWFLEIAPAIIGLIILIVTHKQFPLTPLLYFLVLIHCIILMVGGHYTYAEVPLFDWLKDLTDGNRNNYDKVGHFAQGFVPAMITRELFIRKSVVLNKQWMNIIVVCVAMAISVSYEFIEWFVALGTGEDAEAFLGTQGYVWDTQSDMLLATIGAICALVCLSKMHDNQIKHFLLPKEF